jgi:hypothetical protein
MLSCFQIHYILSFDLMRYVRQQVRLQAILWVVKPGYKPVPSEYKPRVTVVLNVIA